MILNRSHGFIFVHVPKTAGTAVHHYLSRFTTPQDVDICDLPPRMAHYYGTTFNLRKHSTAPEILGFVGEETFKRMFKFALVRNPFARCYSLYRFLKHRFRSWENSSIMDEFDNVDSFVTSDFFQSEGPDRILSPQCFWLCGAEGRLMVDQVGRIERLECEMSKMLGSIGLLPLEQKLDRVNVSPGEGRLTSLFTRLPGGGRIRRAHLLQPRGLLPTPRVDLRRIFSNEETRRILLERYECDFELFGYARELHRKGAAPPATELAKP